MEYNTGNLNKYMTKNPLKRKMVTRLNDRVLLLVKEAAELHRRQGKTLRILDAGCGEGFISGLVQAGVEDVFVTGLEYTREALEIARSMNPDISFIQGDVTAIPFEDGSFDVVLCTEVLEHLQDPGAALRELLRVAEGTLILTVPREPWFCMGNLLVLKNVTRLGNPPDHINHWTYSGFARFLADRSPVKWQMGKSFPWTIARCETNEKQRDDG